MIEPHSDRFSLTGACGQAVTLASIAFTRYDPCVATDVSIDGLARSSSWAATRALTQGSIGTLEWPGLCHEPQKKPRSSQKGSRGLKADYGRCLLRRRQAVNSARGQLPSDPAIVPFDYSNGNLEAFLPARPATIVPFQHLSSSPTGRRGEASIAWTLRPPCAHLEVPCLIPQWRHSLLIRRPESWCSWTVRTSTRRHRGLYGHPLCHPHLLAQELAGGRPQRAVPLLHGVPRSKPGTHQSPESRSPSQCDEVRRRHRGDQTSPVPLGLEL